ncbi:MAG: hypothetical protein ABI559_09510 [Chloroflexota bacterium]
MTKQTTLGLGTITVGVVVALAALLLFASSAFAAGTISGTTENVAAGGTATVTFSESSPTGLGNWQFDITVDAAKLGVPTCANVIPGGGCNIVSGNVVRFAGADGSATGLTGNQTIGTITVTAAAALTTGCSDLTIAATHFEDGTGTAIPTPTITNGKVCIEAAATATATPAPGSATASPTPKALPQTGGPAGDTSDLTWLVAAAGLVIVAAGAWTMSRSRKDN